jgi:hypothetical protein
MGGKDKKEFDFLSKSGLLAPRHDPPLFMGELNEKEPSPSSSRLKEVSNSNPKELAAPGVEGFELGRDSAGGTFLPGALPRITRRAHSYDK